MILSGILKLTGLAMIMLPERFRKAREVAWEMENVIWNPNSTYKMETKTKTMGDKDLGVTPHANLKVAE